MTDLRDSWCTPAWLADLIGPVDLDPCSNERSHVQAATRWTGDPHDGLALAPTVPASARVFVNPPYSHGQVIRWVRAYLHADTLFLVRLDPSTAWWALLMTIGPSVWMPAQRLAFEPPPGVTASTNPFPHAVVGRRLPPALLRAGSAWRPARLTQPRPRRTPTLDLFPPEAP